MRLVTVVGARPQFIKAAPVSAALREHHKECLVHTGQHYDPELSGALIDEIGMPQPDIALGIHGGSAAEQLGRCVLALNEVLVNQQPDAVMVYGDTNSTLAGALAADRCGIPLVHVEAGLRSFDRRMPEERNRIVADHLSSLLLCSSESGAVQLRREGIAHGVHVVGDVMQDALLATQARLQGANSAAILARFGLVPGGYVLATIHRAENTDDLARLRAILGGLAAVGVPVILPLHPRTRQAMASSGLSAEGRLSTVTSLGHLEFVALTSAARCVVTDSGGLQKEAFWLGVPCVTVRTSTEWTETVTSGWNRLVDAQASDIVSAVGAATPQAERPALFGPTGAAARIVELLPRVLE